MGDMMQIRRGMIASQPHIVTANSGNTEDSATICRIRTDVPADVKALAVSFEPTQSGSGTPSPSNVRAISGHNSINVTRCGVNLLQSHSVTSYTGNGVTYTVTRNASGEVSSISMVGTGSVANIFRNLNYTPGGNTLLDGKIATNAFSNQATIIPMQPEGTGDIYDIDGYYKNTFLTAGMKAFEIDKKAYGAPSLFRIQGFPYVSNVSYNTVIYPFASLYQDRNSAFEPYNGQTITITLPSTTYGGQLDVLTGVLTVDWVYQVYNGAASEGWGNPSAGILGCPITNAATTSASDTSSIISSYIPAETRTRVYTGSATSGICLNSGERIWIRFPNYTTSTDWRNYLASNPLQVAYKLATPQTYQLTPQTLKTLRGINNIWSDQGTVTVQYWTH